MMGGEPETLMVGEKTGEKPGPCRHLSFTTIPVLINFIGKIYFFVQFYILVSNYPEETYLSYFFKIKQIKA